MKFQRLILASAVAAAGLTSMTAAQAVTTWAFNYSGPGITATGTFTTAGTAIAPELILSVSGVRNGAAITGLIPVDTDPDFFYDNLFTIASPNFTDGGFLYGVTGGESNVNVYFDAGQYFEVSIEAGGAVNVPINWSVTAVPEPATVLSMLAGLGLLGVYMRKARAAQ
jgi:hypothetical protein